MTRKTELKHFFGDKVYVLIEQSILYQKTFLLDNSNFDRKYFNIQKISKHGKFHISVREYC